ncbi:MAG TPA: MHYT domain-containing protein [Alphaproteobacteria bacterium]|nr:MHYT domain-containing protein [Alphaproteobacteria bacterium]
MTLTGTYDGILVALSFVVAAVAAYTALDLGGRASATAGRAGHAWLAAAAISMGGGIWSMHFVAMLAFGLDIPVSYDLGLTAGSLVLAVAATGCGFAAVAARRASRLRLAFGGLLMGLGIVGMHYMGMAAMRMPVDTTFDGLLVAASLLIAIGAATVALWLAFRRQNAWEKIAAALAMGVAISGMHYTGMAAATFTAADMAHDHSAGALPQIALALAVSAATLFILFLALMASVYDRRFAVLAEREAQALRDSERRFRTLVQNIDDVVLVLDAEGRVRDQSASATRVLGYAPGQLDGLRLANLADGRAADVEAFISGAAGAGGSRLTGELRIRDAAGKERLCEAVAVNLLHDPGVGGLLVTLRDITRRRALEEELAHRQRLEAVGQLTGGIAHDFNNLLTVLVGNLQLVHRRTADERSRGMIEAGLTAARRGAALTEQLLAFSRRQRLRPEPFDPNALADETAALLRRTIGAGVEIVVRGAPDLCSALADPAQVQTALLNLAINARDAMADGGTLSIATEPLELSAPRRLAGQTVAPGRYVVLVVSDDGAGMPPEVLARAVEPFFTTKEPGRGTGLGLSQVFGFAQQSGGFLEIDSAVGRGTTVRLGLPAAAAAAPATADEVLAAAVPRDAVVLVVEDEPAVRALAVSILADAGLDVVEAADADAALAVLARRPDIRLLFTDVVMPGQDGFQLAERARALQPGLQVLFTSGYTPRLKDAARYGPPERILAKPYDPDRLVREVVRALAKGA